MHEKPKVCMRNLNLCMRKLLLLTIYFCIFILNYRPDSSHDRKAFEGRLAIIFGVMRSFTNIYVCVLSLLDWIKNKSTFPLHQRQYHAPKRSKSY